MYRAGPLDQADPAEWDAFVGGHPAGHFLQVSGWGELRSGLGWRVLRLGVRDPTDRLVAGAQILLRRSPLGSIGYVPRGPVCAVGDPAWPTLVAGLRRAMGPWGLALRLEPSWAAGARVHNWLRGQGLQAAEPIQPPSTLLIDLRADEATLLAGFKQKWRYNVRLAGRHGVTVRLGGAAELPIFGALMADTARRDRFHARPAAYYAGVWHALQPQAKLYVAEWSGRILAAILVIHHGGTATYLYGASADQERQRMPNHLLQWEAMRRARAAGMVSYDLWGIPDALGLAAREGVEPEAVPVGQGGLWGVWGFKRGFGGRVWRAVGAWDLVLAPRRYALGRRLQALRRGAARP